MWKGINHRDNHTRRAVRWPLGLLWLGVGVLCVGPFGRLQAGETPEQVLQTIYGADLQKVKATPASNDDRALAYRMISDAKGLKDDKPLQALLLQQAVSLALEDADGPGVAQNATENRVADAGVAPVVAWQDLTDKAAAVLKKRHATRDDPLAEPYCGWLMQLITLANAANDDATADKTLAVLAREAQGYKFKFYADQALQVQGRQKFDAANRAATKAARAKADTGVGADDAKANLAAAEAILSQMGDWTEIEAYRLKAADPRLNQIVELRQQRKGVLPSVLEEMVPTFLTQSVAAALPAAGAAAPAGGVPSTLPAPGPAPVPVPVQGAAPTASPDPATGAAPAPGSAPAAATAPAADTVLKLADYLTALAAPQKRPSPTGKLCLLEEAAALLTQAAEADQAGMSTVQKLELISKARVARDAENKARDEFITAFSKMSNLKWVVLSTGSFADDWINVLKVETWKNGDTGELISAGGEWNTKLMSSRAAFDDFVFEGEYRITQDVTGAFFYFGVKKGPPYYHLEINNSTVALVFHQGMGPNHVTLVQARQTTNVGQWSHIRVVFEGERRMVWIDGKRVIDTKYKTDPVANAPGINTERGSGEFRNLRIRELK